MGNLEDEKFIGYKIKLYPTPEQEQIFKEYFGAARFVYNLCISLECEHYKKHLLGEEKFPSMNFIDLNNKLTELKKTEEYKWLNDFDAKSMTYVVKDLVKSYKNYFQNPSKYRKPRLKKRKNHHQMFPIRSDRLRVNENTVRIPSIGIVYVDNHNHPEIIGSGNTDIMSLNYKHYYNSRIIFDGYSYWISFELVQSLEENNEPNSFKRFKNNKVWQHKKSTNPIGMDINLHSDTWITLSNGKIYQRPNCKKEDRQIAKYSRKLNHKLRMNKSLKEEKKTNSTVANKLEEPSYTKNEEKILKKLNKAYKRRTNKKLAVIHECACDILSEKPEYFVMETLSSYDMLIPRSEEINCKHRKNHNRMVYESMIYTVQRIINEKLSNNNIPVYKADREFPSTQLCSQCGYRQKIGPKRVYKCPHCGNVIDRDMNSAINLSNYFNYNEAVYNIS